MHLLDWILSLEACTELEHCLTTIIIPFFSTSMGRDSTSPMTRFDRIIAFLYRANFFLVFTLLTESMKVGLEGGFAVMGGTAWVTNRDTIGDGSIDFYYDVMTISHRSKQRISGTLPHSSFPSASLVHFLQ